MRILLRWWLGRPPVGSFKDSSVGGFSAVPIYLSVDEHGDFHDCSSAGGGLGGLIGDIFGGDGIGGGDGGSDGGGDGGGGDGGGGGGD